MKKKKKKRKINFSFLPQERRTVPRVQRSEISINLPKNGTKSTTRPTTRANSIPTSARIYRGWSIRGPGKRARSSIQGPRIPSVGQHHAECPVASGRECEPGIVIRA